MSIESAARPTGSVHPSFPNRVKPVSNAIDIIRYLSKSKQPATVTRLARQLSLNPSTCFNILRTLVWEGLIDFNEAAKSYSVGLGILKLAEGALSEGERLVSMKKNMHELAESYRVTLLLWRRVGDDRMLLVSVENSSADLQIQLRTGQRLPLLLGATGRVFASHLGLTKQELKARFRVLRWARRFRSKSTGATYRWRRNRVGRSTTVFLEPGPPRLPHQFLIAQAELRIRSLRSCFAASTTPRRSGESRVV
jgi:DNA-binding IclR family transcriptional regulator